MAAIGTRASLEAILSGRVCYALIELAPFERVNFETKRRSSDSKTISQDEFLAAAVRVRKGARKKNRDASFRVVQRETDVSINHRNAHKNSEGSIDFPLFKGTIQVIMNVNCVCIFSLQEHQYRTSL